MKKFLSVFLVVAMMAISFSVTAFADTADYTVTITNDSTVTAGDTFDLCIEIAGVAEDVEIAYIDFELHYDADEVAPAYTQSSASDTSCIVSTPDDSDWEQIVRLYESGEYYYCFFCPDDGGLNDSGEATDSVISKDKAIVISIPFTVLSEVGGSVSVSVSNVVAYNATDVDFENPLSNSYGGDYTAEVVAKGCPVTSLGAKINLESPALRLGAKYETEYLPTGITSEDITDLGIVFYPTRLLGENELSVETVGAISVSASGIENYDPELTFADYETITFYVTIIDIPANGLDDEISFRAYCSYGEEVIYADTLSRSYDYVLDELYPEPSAGFEGDNVVYPSTSWWE